ncbi:hypothetical protein FA15DRAFT_654845 [Coprinopsis marcescibilis]|uniref:HMG box domain-containing protein n=1 Tax=Coprinopsis marcescibilis TaxID=230819 RepID=A0A5C3KZN8_COPMA|nr:hypothetical protein FA15DRAFT_654845 [Coprinopsis marcescibilis]
MSSLSRLLGWAPSTDAGYIDVAVPEHISYQHDQDYFDVDTTPTQSGNYRTFHASPSASTSSLSDTERSPEPAGKKADPNWVARPRNEFILFRCDYVRRHTKEGTGKRTRRAPGQEAEKTLSKLASEAWRALPTEERLYWREQANFERTNHAQKYPDYRYRPKKSNTGRKRQSRSSMASMMSKASPAPALLAPITVDASHSGSGSPTNHLERYPPILRLHNPLRKAISAPYLTGGDPGAWGPQSLPPSEFHSRHGSMNMNFDYPPPVPPLPSMPSTDNLPSGAATPALSESMSIPNSASSSLVNWNGELVLSAPQPTQFISPFSLSLIDPSLLPQSPNKFASAVRGGVPAPQSTNAVLNFGHPPQQHHLGMAMAPGMMSRTTNHADPFSFGNGSATMLFGGSDIMSKSALLHDEFGMPCNAALPTTISPAEYFGSSAEMSPDEMFLMDNDEYFPQY